MERLSDLSLMAAIALENLRHDRKASSEPILEFVTALKDDSPSDEKTKSLVTDYRRVNIYNEAWQRLTGHHLENLGELASMISGLLEDMQGDLANASEKDIKHARDFCLALNRTLVDADYEDLRATTPSTQTQRL